MYRLLSRKVNLLFRGELVLDVNRVLFESALKGSLNHHGHFRLLPANFAELLSAEFPQILKLAAVLDASRILRRQAPLDSRGKMKRRHSFNLVCSPFPDSVPPV